MNSFLKSLGLVTVLGSALSAQASVSTKLKPPFQDGQFHCVANEGKDQIVFDLTLAHLATRVEPYKSFAKITTKYGETNGGTFTFALINNYTRLHGYTKFAIKTGGELGSLTLNLVGKPDHLFGSGELGAGKDATTLLLGCKAK